MGRESSEAWRQRGSHAATATAVGAGGGQITPANHIGKCTCIRKQGSRGIRDDTAHVPCPAPFLKMTCLEGGEGMDMSPETCAGDVSSVCVCFFFCARPCVYGGGVHATRGGRSHHGAGTRMAGCRGEVGDGTGAAHKYAVAPVALVRAAQRRSSARAPSGSTSTAARWCPRPPRCWRRAPSCWRRGACCAPSSACSMRRR